jgi:hypothetical protein
MTPANNTRGASTTASEATVAGAAPAPPPMTAHQLELQELELRVARARARTAEAEYEALTARNDAQSRGISGIGAEDLTGELTPEGVTLCQQHPGVDPRSIMQISKGTFQPWNLCKLRIGAIQIDREETSVLSFGDHGLQTKTLTGGPKDYGFSSGPWVQYFTSYISILLLIHGTAHPQLAYALLSYFSKIQRLAGIYKWQSQVLPLAISTHTFAIAQGVTNPESWQIDAQTVDNWCRYTSEASTSSSSSAPQKRGNSGGQGGGPRKKLGPTCYKYNGFKGCNDDPCMLRHACGYCDEKGHSKMVCPDLKDSKK